MCDFSEGTKATYQGIKGLKLKNVILFHLKRHPFLLITF